MVTSIHPTITAETFEGWAVMQDDNFEFIAGEVVLVSSNHYASALAARLLYLISAFIVPRKLGWVTGADGGYRVAGERYMPDIAYISYAKQPHPSQEGFLSLPPDLAVEIISNPSNIAEQNHLRVKVSNYLLEGVVVWVINPETEQVEIHRNNQPVAILRKTGVIRDEALLPGFELLLTDLFDDAQG